MRRLLLLLLVSGLLSACAPALRQELLDRGEPNPPLRDMQANPSAYIGKLYILGGMIVQTRFVQRGTQIEAVALEVNSRGDLTGKRSGAGRFLAIYPRDQGILEPEIYKKNRKVTIAGEFIGVQTGKIDELEYHYPTFEVKDIHLWEEERAYYYPPYYGPQWYSPYYRPYYHPFWWDDPFWRFRPYPYWW